MKNYLKQHITGFIGGLMVCGLLLLSFMYISLARLVASQGVLINSNAQELKQVETAVVNIGNFLQSNIRANAPEVPAASPDNKK
jgi:hypothetical protein